MAKRSTVDPEQLADTTKLEDSLVLLIDNLKKYVVPAIVLVVVLMIVAMVISRQQSASEAAAGEAFAALSEAMTMNLPPEPDEAAEQAALEGRLVKLDSVIANFPDSDVAKRAAFAKAKTYYSLEQYEKAAESFGSFAQTYPGEAPYTALAYMGQGNALVEQGDIDAALETFLTITKLGENAADTNILGQAKFRAALCAAVTGDKDQARTLLEELLASPIDEFLKQRTQEALDNLDTFPTELLQQLDEPLEEEAPEDAAGGAIQGLPQGLPEGLQLTPMPAGQ